MPNLPSDPGYADFTVDEPVATGFAPSDPGYADFTIGAPVPEGNLLPSDPGYADFTIKAPRIHKRWAFIGGKRYPLLQRTGGRYWDWSDTNQPWAYDSTEQFTTRWPAGVLEADLVNSGTGNFRLDLAATLAPFPSTARVVVRVPAGVHHLKSFESANGNPIYAFGFFFGRKLRGLLGAGPDRTFIQMDPGSVTNAQLAAMAELTYGAYAPLQMGFARFDGLDTSLLISGLTFRSTDQPALMTVADDIPPEIMRGQPAPHQGVILYPGSTAKLAYVRFQGAAKAWTSRPPFEMANLTSQYGDIELYRCELDSRRSPDVDPNRTRSCGPIMANNETKHVLDHVWFHRSNVSRYAANDENRDTQGLYRLYRTVGDYITDTANDGKGGASNASVTGWESCNGTIEWEDVIMRQRNSRTNTQLPHHVSFTNTGSRTPTGGTFHVSGDCVFENPGFPSIFGFLSVRSTASSGFTTGGYSNTMFVYDKTGNRLAPYQVTGTWPPTKASLDAVGVTPTTHFLVRG